MSALIWDFSGKISNQIVSVLVTVVLARILEPADFGLVAICLVFIGIAQVFTDVGLGSA
ncbi:MAG: teichuronic acid exporter, partial [Psychroserpens sp.]